MITYIRSLAIERRAWRIAAIYAVVAMLWIVFSDRALEVFVRDPERIQELGTIKGLGFVFVTAVMLLLLVGDALQQLRRSERALHTLNVQLEQKVTFRTAELREALIAAEKADSMKTAFLATMSHELRTPLNSIIGFTGILLQGLAGDLTAEQRKQLSMVQSSARHLLALINDILDISRIEAGELSVERETVDLHALLTEVVEGLRPLASHRGLALRLTTQPDLGSMQSDARRIRQILVNLVNNAIKFTESGHVHVNARVTDGLFIVDVVDTGIGIREEHLPGLFAPFLQIDSGTARKYEGTGLGLAICRLLSKKLGGRVRAASEWGRGSTFTLELPT